MLLLLGTFVDTDWSFVLLVSFTTNVNRRSSLTDLAVAALSDAVVFLLDDSLDLVCLPAFVSFLRSRRVTQLAAALHLADGGDVLSE